MAHQTPGSEETLQGAIMRRRSRYAGGPCGCPVGSGECWHSAVRFLLGPNLGPRPASLNSARYVLDEKKKKKKKGREAGLQRADCSNMLDKQKHNLCGLRLGGACLNLRPRKVAFICNSTISSLAYAFNFV